MSTKRYTLQHIANLFGEMDELKEELAARDAENAKLREVLQWYAETYVQVDGSTFAASDGGERARRALLAEGEAK